jgi:CheY-like chemotaxis protein
MGGHIAVTDNKPRGTVFKVTLPIDESVYENVEELTQDGDALADELITDNGVQEKPTILVVDDNTDARLFLQRSLDDEYHVLVAANGKEALRMLARKDDVSIIVSDVMMPEMDGIELFREIKGNINFSHIPVILLTAKSSEENIVEGLEEGVADYITKPFSLAVLRLRIRKVIEWSQNVHNIVATGIEIKPSEITVSSLDEELISHVISHIEANMQDVNYSVVQLSSDVGMTRGHLYKKLMAITGKSPLEFIRIIKLKRGKSLLDQGRTNISEVADMVGLSAKQFAHYFKLMYDDTPSDYLKKLHH